MHKFLIFLSLKRTGDITALLMVLFLGLLSIIRLYPFNSNFLDLQYSNDDWANYIKYALDIKENGMLMPIVKGIYLVPAGFLYNYFLALCFTLFGNHTVPVYIIQNLLIGFSSLLIYWTFRNKMKPLTAFAFLISIFFIALTDMSLHYTFQLLSENLVIFTLSVFFFCFIKGIEKNNLFLLITAGIFLGFSTLTRPNIFLFGILMSVFLIKISLKKNNPLRRNLLMFLIFLLLSASLLAFRNYFACGRLSLLPIKFTAFNDYFIPEAGLSFGYYIRKSLFFLGYLSPFEPGYAWRIHWTIMWAGYAVYFFLYLQSKVKMELWEIMVHLFVVCYYLTLFVMGVNISNYGFRFLLPVIFLLLPFSFLSYDKIKEKASDYFLSQKTLE
ncbi:MAG: glycosyltransferase family 39 protein [Bacteroidales bacterium]|nr:glycosyltransferase family 39 protein [Bacteroidales bacterium]